MQQRADIGIIGGSGFYSFFEDTGMPYETIAINTPYGAPSDKITIGEIEGKKVAFLPRHGKDHRFPPHLVNYRANVWAMHSLGVKRVISPCAAGSLQKNIKPGDVVICDQIVDWTFGGRKSTFIEGPIVIHPSVADTYCPELRQVAIDAAKKHNIPVHEKGTIVIINGPRFTTKAESQFFTNQGWGVINMSQYPEVYLVRECDMCPVTIALITDYDAGLVGDVPAVTHQEVMKTFKENNEKLLVVLKEMIKNIPSERHNCECEKTMHTS